MMLGEVVYSAGAQEEVSFLRKHDLWVCVGDSITYNDTYRRTMQRIADHFHPDDGIRVVNNGIWGTAVSGTKDQFEKSTASERPTVASVMIGMVDMYRLTEWGWHRGMPIEPLIEKYRQNLTAVTRAIREKGVLPVLLTPTLTDESSGWSHYWELTGSREVVRGYGRVVREVAEKEGAFWLPVSEEMDAAQSKTLNEQVFCADGVHPDSLGQYAIAASILKHCAFAGKLADGARKLTAPPVELPVRIRLGTRFLDDNADGIPFTITTDKPLTVKLTWSYRKLRGQETLKLSGNDTWELKLPKDALIHDLFQADDIVMDLTDGLRRNIYIVDLFKTRVLHFQNDTISGVLESKEDRPEGRKVANWRVSRIDNRFLGEAEVFDSEIRPGGVNYIRPPGGPDWPYSREGVTFWMDYRPTERFADIGADSDVHQVMLHVYDKPFFNVAFWPWVGRGMIAAGRCTGEKIPTGYVCRLFVGERFFTLSDSDLSRRDFVGFNLYVWDVDTAADGKEKTACHMLVPHGHDTYANNLMIIDLKNRFSGNSIINVHLTKL